MDEQRLSLPSSVFVDDDGVLTFEWAEPNRRVGLILAEDERHWYLIEKDGNEVTSDLGSIDNDLKNFIISLKEITKDSKKNEQEK